MKRKSNQSDEEVPKKRYTGVKCIFHVNGIHHGDFTPFSNVQGPANDKLAQLHDIRNRRLSEPQDSPNRMEDACNQMPASLDGVNLKFIGYHRGCYQKFTKNLDRLKSDAASNSNDNVLTSRSRRKPSSQLFPPECIFCQKLELKLSGRTERCITFPIFKNEDGALKDPTWKQIECRALELRNYPLHRMVHGEDLFAREARFHPSCRKSFNLKYINHMRDTSKATNRASFKTEQDRKADAHSKAFTAVIDYIEDCIISQNKVVQLSSLRLLYIQELERNGFTNPEYRSEKLKSRLEKHAINERIAFSKVNPGDKGCITYNLVYSANISVADAVAYAYKLASKDKCEDMALILRSVIQRAFIESKPLPWPPSADDLEVKSSNELLPPDHPHPPMT